MICAEAHLIHQVESIGTSDTTTAAEECLGSHQIYISQTDQRIVGRTSYGGCVRCLLAGVGEVGKFLIEITLGLIVDRAAEVLSLAVGIEEGTRVSSSGDIAELCHQLTASAEHTPAAG